MFGGIQMSVAGMHGESLTIVDRLIASLRSQDPQTGSKPSVGGRVSGPPIGVAFIGVGARGSHLLRTHGFWPDSELIKIGATKAPFDMIPNTDVRAICDVYKGHLVRAGATVEKYTKRLPRLTADWRDVIADKSIDAVYIATADVWHGPIAIAAVEAGKHVYVEKCMTQTVEEAKRLRDAARKSKSLVVQVGHQNRHNSYQQILAKLVKDGVLGKVSVIQTALGRNTPEGAYALPILARIEADPEAIAWDSYIPKGVEVPRRSDRLFNWRKYWSFSTGISGDLLSHEVDAANMVLDLDIPDQVTASGGIYAHKDGRETPDVYSVIHDYRDRELSLTYNATLSNSFERKSLFLGSDATAVLGFDLNVYPDFGSTRYAAELASRKLNPDNPFIQFQGPAHDPRLKTSPTLAWADNKGLTFTVVNGKRYDVTRKAIEEFHENIQKNGKPLCGVDEGFKVAVACHMGTASYREKRPVRWDRESEKIV